MRKSVVERNAALLLSIFDQKQAKEEALLRAQVAQAYSSRSSAELWNRVAVIIDQEQSKAGYRNGQIPCLWHCPSSEHLAQHLG